MSSSSSQSVPLISPLYFSSHELSHMVTQPEFVFPLARMFTNEPLPSAVLQYYGFISQIINNLAIILNKKKDADKNKKWCLKL